MWKLRTICYMLIHIFNEAILQKRTLFTIIKLNFACGSVSLCLKAVIFTEQTCISCRHQGSLQDTKIGHFISLKFLSSRESLSWWGSGKRVSLEARVFLKRILYPERFLCNLKFLEELSKVIDFLFVQLKMQLELPIFVHWS